jgi:hypothetical protein
MSVVSPTPPARPPLDFDALADSALLPVEDVASWLRCSTRHVRRLAEQYEELRALRVGSLSRWRVSGIRRYLQRLERAGR